MKKILCWFLMISLIIQLMPSLNLQAQTILSIGDYVYFGQYNGQPILWRVIQLDQEGDPLFFSERIISYKAFDAAENEQFTKEKDRRVSGSNRWFNSNIREWLNSESPFVTYTSTAPTGEHLLDGHNAYEQEPGFLSLFTSKDREAIKPVLHKALLPQADESFFDGGSELHTYKNTSAKDAVANYDNAYFEKVQDAVFLLSIEELAEYVASRGWSYNKGATPQALIKDESGLAKDSLGSYWLRTPSAVNEEFVRYVYNGSFVYFTLANDGSFGICPALYLDLDLAQLRSGAGKIDNPYYVEGINEPITLADSNLEAAIRQNIDQPSGDIMLSDVLKIKELDASGRQIESLEGIQRLAGLEALDISYNKITDITPLRSLRKLKRLFAQYNEITSLLNLFYNQDRANSSLEEINIVGNNITEKDSEINSVEQAGIRIVSVEADEGNSGIDAIIASSEGKTKQEIAAEVERLVKIAGLLELPATFNEITLTGDLLKPSADAAMKVAKQAEKTLLSKEINLNHTIKSVVDVHVSAIDPGQPLLITLDPTILTLNGTDEIEIRTNTYVLSLSPQKLMEDFSTTASIQLMVQVTNETQEVETLDDLSATTNMGQFAQQIRAKSESAIKGLLPEQIAEEILYNGLLGIENRNIEILTVAFEKDGNITDQLETSISIGLNPSIDPNFDCIFLRNEGEEVRIVGGQFDAYNKRMTITTSDAGQYYLSRNNQYYRDMTTLSEEEKMAVGVLSAKGFLEARSEREFAPHEAISREELATAIVKMTYLYDEEAFCDFTDVSRTDPFYHYIASSREKGIVNGYPDNTFKPTNAISNNEIVKINAAILAYDGYIYPNSDETYITFTNDTQIKSWVTQYLNLLMREEGFLSTGDSAYDGEVIVTRKEAAVLLYKLYKKL